MEKISYFNADEDRAVTQYTMYKKWAVRGEERILRLCQLCLDTRFSLSTLIYWSKREAIKTASLYLADKRLSNSLLSSLILTTDAFNTLALEMYARESYWEKTFFGHTFTMSRESCPEMGDVGAKTLVMTFKSWLQGHEEAQVMLASILVVIGMWWLVRTLLALVINLICPILVVLLAVICVPQLRTPLLGQNYPLLANLLKNILMKLAENIKT